MPTSDRLARAVVEKIQNQLESNTFSDIVINVQNTEFKCHRFILCACSKYFEDACSSLQDENMPRIDVENINAETFSLVLDSIYGAKDILTVDNVEAVWLAAKQLEIDFLYEACERNQCDQLSMENCIQLTIQARRLDSMMLLEASRCLIIREFQNVYKYDDFVLLDPEDIKFVISNDKLGVSSEDSVVSAILKWVHLTKQMGDNEVESRNKSLILKQKERAKESADLLKACRLCLVSGRSLQTLVDDDLVGRNRKAFAVIREALRYQLQPEKQGFYCPPIAVHRSSSLLQNVILTVCKAPNGSIYILGRTIDGTWYRLENGSPQAIKKDIFTASFYSSIYLTGNIQRFERERTISMHTFDTELGTWHEVPALHAETDQFAIISLDHYLYAVSFANSTTIKRLNLLDSASSQWNNVGSLQNPVDKVVLTLCGSAIIILGYEAGSNEITIQSFDTATMTCSTYEKKIQVQANGESVVSFYVAKDTYILLPTGELWKLLTCDKHRVKMTNKGKLFEGHLNLNAAVIFNDTLIISASKVNPQMSKQWETHCIDNVTNVEIIERESRCLLNTVFPQSLLVNKDK